MHRSASQHRGIEPHGSRSSSSIRTRLLSPVVVRQTSGTWTHDKIPSIPSAQSWVRNRSLLKLHEPPLQRRWSGLGRPTKGHIGDVSARIGQNGCLQQWGNQRSLSPSPAWRVSRVASLAGCPKYTGWHIERHRELRTCTCFEDQCPLFHSLHSPLFCPTGLLV